ncbi:uncharacterized protein LOC126568617 [Anopheles maculipalpis]|uniref:uncharacterized protein LOC126568617 n=1 Tax=Anopheles maculipalpis TaxID=1496333 RepID=UPI00215928B1|nr:uncharacterized protein LOC126568617 [Anopheles maculipalpis]
MWEVVMLYRIVCRTALVFNRRSIERSLRSAISFDSPKTILGLELNGKLTTYLPLELRTVVAAKCFLQAFSSTDSTGSSAMVSLSQNRCMVSSSGVSYADRWHSRGPTDE